MPYAKTRVLIADDDEDLRDILRSVLEPAGFEVAEADAGDRALAAVRTNPPSLVILDYMMPGMTGPQVCEQLRQDLILRHVPIIMLTGKSEVHDKVAGLNAGADDYLVKPFEPTELLARVQMILRRATRDLEANPLTRLPGNVSIQRELEERLSRRPEELAVCYIDLDRFKAFNDHYGFKRGDEVITATADVLLHASRTSGSDADFVGHIGGDDFIVLTERSKAEGLCEEIVRRFDAMAQQLYDTEDRARGYIVHTDRKGHKVHVPFLSVSIALVTSDAQPLTHPGQIARIGAELKAYAKQFNRSIYVKERRVKS
jgi:diguanylate cyclase (GGDEF)-like protein